MSDEQITLFDGSSIPPTTNPGQLKIDIGVAYRAYNKAERLVRTAEQALLRHAKSATGTHDSDKEIRRWEYQLMRRRVDLLDAESAWRSLLHRAKNIFKP